MTKIFFKKYYIYNKHIFLDSSNQKLQNKPNLIRVKSKHLQNYHILNKIYTFPQKLQNSKKNLKSGNTISIIKPKTSLNQILYPLKMSIYSRKKKTIFSHTRD